MPFLESTNRTFVNAVGQAAWSPNKDLIACLTVDCQLHAYREFPQFQRIWALSFQNEPTAVCWHPDGVRLAVGHSDGSISFINAENGNCDLKSKLQESAITCVTWSSTRMRNVDDSKLSHDMLTRFTRLCPWDPAQTTETKEAPKRPAQADAMCPPLLPSDFEVLDILCSCDAAGNVSLAAFGHYPILSFNLAKVLKMPIGDRTGPSPKCTAQQALICKSLSRIFITYGTSADTSKPGTLGAVVCSLHSISTRTTELHAVLLVAAALRNLMAECRSSNKRLYRPLQTARSTFVKAFALYNTDPDAPMDVHKRWEAIKCDLRDRLLSLLVRGVITPQLLELLTQRPGEHGLKQAARSIDSSLTSAHNDVLVPLSDSLQQTVFLLDELTGILKSSPAYDGLGIKVAAAKAAKATAARLLVRLEGLQKLVTSAACQYRVFFQRLLACVRSISDSKATPPGSADAADHNHAALAFLENNFVEDSLMQEILSEEQPRLALFDVERKPLAPRQTERVLNLLNIVLAQPPAKPCSFKAAMETLAKQVTDLFAKLPESLCSEVKPLSKLVLSARGKGQLPCSQAMLFMPPAEGASGGNKPAASTPRTPSQSSPEQVILQFCCALNSKKFSDSVVQLYFDYVPREPCVRSIRGYVLDVARGNPEVQVVDAHCFRNNSILLLTKCAAQPADTGASKRKLKDATEGRLSLVPCQLPEDKWVQLDAHLQQDCVQTLVTSGGLVQLREDDEEVKMRQTPSGLVNAPLVVSVARALAAVCAMQRITVYDLDMEEDDDDDNEGMEADSDDGNPEEDPADASAPMTLETA